MSLYLHSRLLISYPKTLCITQMGKTHIIHRVNREERNADVKG